MELTLLTTGEPRPSTAVHDAQRPCISCRRRRGYAVVSRVRRTSSPHWRASWPRPARTQPSSRRTPVQRSSCDRFPLPVGRRPASPRPRAPSRPRACRARLPCRPNWPAACPGRRTGSWWELISGTASAGRSDRRRRRQRVNSSACQAERSGEPANDEMASLVLAGARHLRSRRNLDNHISRRISSVDWVPSDTKWAISETFCSANILA